MYVCISVQIEKPKALILPCFMALGRNWEGTQSWPAACAWSLVC